MKKILLILLLLSFVTCQADPDEMIQVYRENDRQKMVEMFRSENIPYKILNENQIYYPLSYRDKVKKIKEEIWGPVDDSKKGVSVKIDVAPSLAAALAKNKIPFGVNFNDRESVFTWQSYYNKAAMSIVYNVVP